MIFLLAAVAVLAAPRSVDDAPVILLKPETTFSVRFGAKPSSWVSVPEIVAAPSAGTERLADRMQSTSEAQLRETMETAPLPDAEPPKPDQLRIELHRLQGRPGVMLMIANGYSHRLIYQAVLIRGDRRQPTTVCAVRPGLYGIETWPYPLDGVELSGLLLSDTAAADC